MSNWSGAVSDLSADGAAVDGRFDVLVVGGGHAGVQVAVVLAASFEGSIALLSAERTEPYERPPLTKGFLTGEVLEHDLLLRPTGFWKTSGVSLLLDHRVAEVDAERHTVTTADGRRFAYGTLVWAAGADPLRIGITGAGMRGVHELRTLDDTARFRTEVEPGTRVVVIGGGYVGLEAASASVKLGADVTIVEAQPRLLSRVTGTDVADYVLRRHRSSGATVELDAPVTGLVGCDGAVTGVQLADGREVPADVVLVSVGIVPTTTVLAAAGARCSNGIEVDLQGRTSLPDIYAAGDCTCFPDGDGGRIRLESLQNAVEQGEVVAQTILGNDVSYHVVPYFWSNQLDMKIKTIGIFTGHDQALVRGDQDGGSFSVVYLREGRVCAVDAVNSMKDYVDARLVLGRRVAVDQVCDSSARLRDAVIADQQGDGAA